jgi:hypothetical protein
VILRRILPPNTLATRSARGQPRRTPGACRKAASGMECMPARCISRSRRSVGATGSPSLSEEKPAPRQKQTTRNALAKLLKKLAPRAGFEPATNRLTDNFGAVSRGNLPVRRVTKFCGHPCAYVKPCVTWRNRGQHPNTPASAVPMLSGNDQPVKSWKPTGEKGAHRSAAQKP